MGGGHVSKDAYHSPASYNIKFQKNKMEAIGAVADAEGASVETPRIREHRRPYAGPPESASSLAKVGAGAEVVRSGKLESHSSEYDIIARRTVSGRSKAAQNGDAAGLPNGEDHYKTLLAQDFSNSFCFNIKNRSSQQTRKQRSNQTESSEQVESYNSINEEYEVGRIHGKVVAPFNSEHKVPLHANQAAQRDVQLGDERTKLVHGAFASPMIAKSLYQTDEKARLENHSSRISSKDIYDKSIEIDKLTGSKGHAIHI